MMTDSELIAVLSEAEADAAIFSGNFMRTNKKLLQAYFGEAEGDFVAPDDGSSVVSTDVFDVVESDMPSLMRIFTGSGDIMTFKPNTSDPKDIEEAEQKTKYINWVVKNQEDSFDTLQTWIKDAEMQKNGVIKFFFDESVEVETVEYENVSPEELQEIEDSLKGSDIDRVKVEIAEQDESAENAFDIKFRVTTKKQELKIINVPAETFLLTRNATNIKDAELVGDRNRKTRGELIADGFPRELVEQLSKVDFKTDNSTEVIRNRDQGGVILESSIADWASELVDISDLYPKIDYDGDGIAERRHVIISGNHVLVNEPFNLVPYASLTAVPIPHKAIGMSRSEVPYKHQRIQTALKRGILNNIYMVNNPRNIVHPDVDLDDMLANRVNGIVRLEDDTRVTPQTAVMPLTVPYIGDRALQVSQFFDMARAKSTGGLLANQGLDADKLTEETATKSNIIKDDSDAKMELIARNYAETGFRDLFNGLAWLANRFQNKEMEIRAIGKEFKINPSSWKYKHKTQSVVGLGAGNNKTAITSLQGLYAIQTQLQQIGSPLSDNKKIYNTVKRIIDGLGMPSADEFINNPDEPQELLLAQNEQLNKMVLQLQQQMQQLQNPLAEAEQIKQKAFLVKAQSDAQIQVAKLQEDQRQFNEKLKEDSENKDKELALKLTDLESKIGKDLSQQTQQNIIDFEFDPSTGELNAAR